MKTLENEEVRNTESNTAITCVKEPDANNLSKEKEDERLDGMEDNSDDEDAQSDDSLRLRLSDDEQDAEHEEHTAILCTDVLESESRNGKTEQLLIDAIVEDTPKLESQLVVERIVELSSEVLTQKSDAAINSPENSTLSTLLSDEYIIESESARSGAHSLEISAIVEHKYMSDAKTINSGCHNKEISQIVSDVKNQLAYDSSNGGNIDIALLNSNAKREDSEIKCTSNSVNKDCRIKEVNVLTNAEQRCTSEKDSSCAVESNDSQNAEVVIHGQSKLRRTTSDHDSEINFANTCEAKLDTIVDDNALLASVVGEVEICNGEKSSTMATIASDDDNLIVLSATITDKVVASFCDTRTVENLLPEINDSRDITNIIRSGNPKDDSSSRNGFTGYDSKEQNTDEDNIRDINALKKLTTQRKAIIVSELNQTDSSEDGTKAINKDTNEPFVSRVISNKFLTESASLPSTSVENSNKNEKKNTNTIVRKRKRLKESMKLEINMQNCTTEENKQEVKENGRKKRKTAKNAEEIIRKKYLNSDSDSTDDSEELITFNPKINKNLRPASPPSLKRNCSDSDDPVLNGNLKKTKNAKSEEKDMNSVTKLAFVEKFFQRDSKDKLKKFTQEVSKFELEELLIQKIVETLTMRSEIGQLREQARISERNHEAMRVKLQQLQKQVKDFEMVLNRNAIDRRTNPERFVAPIKINRSVGLQVNFITEHGMQTLRQVQQTVQIKPANTVATTPTVATVATTSTMAPSSVSGSSATEPSDNAMTNPRRGIKIRPPRQRPEAVIATASSASAISQNPIQTVPLISTVTPAALVVAKPLDSQLTLSNQSNNIQQLIPQQQQQQSIQSRQTIILNGKVQTQNRPIAPKLKNDLIDLTDEEEKSKSTKVTNVPVTSAVEPQLSTTSKTVQCFPRVIQTIPANVAITTQPTNIRVVQPNQPTPTAIANNISQPRLAYVTRQVVITSNPNQIRPVTTVTVRPSFSTVTYKGVSTIANGNVRVLTTSASANIQTNKHPASLPDTPTYALTPGWKLPPPAPSLKISKVSNGIVLSWNMNLSDKYADIASYQLYAYQEIVGTNPSTSLWKKVGDVRALPLPMACTLTQFSEGNNYYFAVRAVDTHSRKGQYSAPGNISL